MSQFLFVVFIPCEDRKSENGSRSRLSSVSSKSSKRGSSSLPPGNDPKTSAESQGATNTGKDSDLGASAKSLPILEREGSIPHSKSTLSLSPEKLTKVGLTANLTEDATTSKLAKSTSQSRIASATRKTEFDTKEDARDVQESIQESNTPSVEWDFCESSKEGETSKAGVVSSDNIELQVIPEKTTSVKHSANGQIKGKFIVQLLQEGSSADENLPDQTPGQHAEEHSKGSKKTPEQDTEEQSKESTETPDQDFEETSLESEEAPQQGAEEKSQETEGNNLTNSNKSENANASENPDKSETSDNSEKSADKSEKGSEAMGTSVLSSVEEEKEKKKGKEEIEFVDFLGPDDMTIVQKVEIVLRDLMITKVTWQKSKNDKFFQVTFETSGVQVEQALNRLHYIGVGEGNTSISVYPATLHYEGSGSSENESESESDSEEEKQIQEVAAKLNWKTSEFKKSIKARLVVDQVVENIRLNAEFTFDYLMLIILASIIACLGLAENSSVVLVASMLISPLMGPILAGTFGIVIKNTSLRNTGFRSELIGLGICLVSGFLFGLISGAVNLRGAVWGSSESWPTEEMASRGHYRSLWVGVLIALPSGAGVALSVLGGNAGSLVGVAISASLLPPAVNAGMLWAFALLTLVLPLQQLSHQTIGFNVTVNTTDAGCPSFVNNEYQAGQYSCTMAVEALVLGFISLLLTLLNIICIFIMGIIVLKIKEVAPRTSHLGATKDFFHRDIKVARDAYSTLKGQSSKLLGQKFLEEYKKLVNEDIITEDDINTLEVRDIIEEVEQSDDVQGLISRVPGKSKAKPISSHMKDIFQEAESSVYIRENLDTISPYHTITGQPRRPYSGLSPASPVSAQMLTPFGAQAFMRRHNNPESAQLTIQREPHSHHRPISAAPDTPTITEEEEGEGNKKPENSQKQHRHLLKSQPGRFSYFMQAPYTPHHTFIPPAGYHSFIPTGMVQRNVHFFDPHKPMPPQTLPSVSIEDGKGKGKKKKTSFDVTAVAESSTSKGVSAKKTRFNVQNVPEKSNDTPRDSSKNAKDSHKKSKDSPKKTKDSSNEYLLGKPSPSLF